MTTTRITHLRIKLKAYPDDGARASRGRNLVGFGFGVAGRFADLVDDEPDADCG